MTGVKMRRVAGFLPPGFMLLLFLFGSGCATVNTQSAVRLAGDAQLTIRGIADSLEGTRGTLETFVEGQLLHGHLTGRSTLSPSELCSIKAVQRSLRLRVILLRKLASLYNTFIDLASYDNLEGGGIFDEMMGDLDRYELLPDATPGPTCPDPDPQPAAAPPRPLPAPPSKLLGFSRSASLRRGSELIRQVLSKFIKLWEQEQSVYLSIQRQAFLSQKTLTRALFVKFGTLSPAAVFAPQLAGLGVAWDERAYQGQLEHWPAEKQNAVRDAVLLVLDRRTEHRIAEQEARYVQHGALLHALYRQHQVLEAGLPLDLREIASFLVPILQSINLNRCCCGATGF